MASATTMRIRRRCPLTLRPRSGLACAAFDAISCEGLARVDFFYTPAGEILVNEINTMTGMTPASGSRHAGRLRPAARKSSSTGSSRPRCASGPGCA